MTIHVETARIDAHSSRARCWLTDITLDPGDWHGQHRDLDQGRTPESRANQDNHDG